MRLKSWFFDPNRKHKGRAVCVLAGVFAAAWLFHLGYLSAEPTLWSGIAFAAMGAIAGLVVYGLYDVARKFL